MLGILRSGNKRTKSIWWALIILTVASFIGGFIFLAGVGQDQASRARATGHVGSVNGDEVSIAQWQAALEEARFNYRRQYGTEPQDRDLKTVQQQAWRTLVNERMFAQEAKKAGLKATDNDVLVGMRTNPPAVLLASPTFQTDGQFDIAKYQQALSNPSPELAPFWAQFENQLREQLPVRKLQERLLSSLKMSQPELRDEFNARFDRASATLVTVPAADTGRSAGDEATLKKVYEEYRSRMAAPARTQLEVLVIPKKYGPEETKAAMDLARSLFDRAARGEDFGQLARDYSEGPNAEKGGAIDRWVMPGELGTIIGAAVAVKKPGEVIEPVQEGGRVLLLKLLDPAKDTLAMKTPPPGPGAVRLAQIVVKIRPSMDDLRKQKKEAEAIAARAKALSSLSKAATDKGLSTFKTGYYDQNNGPPQLFAVPEAADWGLSAKKNEVSPVWESSDEFAIVQCVMQHAAGAPTRDEVGEQLKMIADAEARVDMAKPRADALAAAIKGGQSLEDAAKAAGLPVVAISTSRAQPDPRLSGAPELVGMLFSVPRGKIIGPIRSSQGWMFARAEGVSAAPDSLFNDQTKGQITNEVLNRRQRGFFDSFVEKLRGASKISDLRGNEDGM